MYPAAVVTTPGQPPEDPLGAPEAAHRDVEHLGALGPRPLERGVQHDVLVGDVERPRLAPAQGVRRRWAGSSWRAIRISRPFQRAPPTTVPLMDLYPCGAARPKCRGGRCPPRQTRGHRPRPASWLSRTPTTPSASSSTTGRGPGGGRPARVRAGPHGPLGRRAAGDDPQHLTAPDRVGRLDESGTVVGAAGLVMPRHDNLAQAGVIVIVHPTTGAAGSARPCWTTPRLLPASTAARCCSPRPSGGWASATRAARSSPLARVCRRADRAAQLPVPARGPGRLEAVLAAHGADGYAMQTCWDGIPEAWLAGRAELSRRMSTDIPMGDLVLEEEVWDEERVRTDYERIAAIGRRVVDTFAVEEATGELVGYTQVQVRGHPAGGVPAGHPRDARAPRSRPGAADEGRRHPGPDGGVAARRASARGTPTTTPRCWRSTARSATSTTHDARVAEGGLVVMDDPVDVDLGTVVSIHVAKATKLPMGRSSRSWPRPVPGWSATATTAPGTAT